MVTDPAAAAKESSWLLRLSSVSLVNRSFVIVVVFILNSFLFSAAHRGLQLALTKVYCQALFPFTDMPLADHPAEHEGVAAHELLCGLAAGEDRHRSLGGVGERSSHQERPLSLELEIPRPMSREELGSLGQAPVRELVEEDVFHTAAQLIKPESAGEDRAVAARFAPEPRGAIAGRPGESVQSLLGPPPAAQVIAPRETRRKGERR